MQRIRNLLLALAALTLTSGLLSAQNVISGVISDTHSVPVIAATIMVSGTTNGTFTNELGEFSIQANPTDTLIIELIGYKSEIVPVNGRSTIAVTLEEDSEMLEGTVVVGYGSAQKIGNIVGSVKTVSADALKQRPSANIGDALQGQVSGLQIFSGSGEPTSGVAMTLRGASSINMSTAPLYILDGVPVGAQVFTSINPQDIESISVLKDASSTAIYGSRAASGVIFINTKQGKKGERPTVSVRGQYGVSMLTHFNLDMMNSEELFRFEELCLPELKDNVAYQANKTFVLGNGINFDWMDYLFSKSAPTAQVDLTVRGASERTNYYISAGFHSEKGTVKVNSDMKRFNFRSNLDIQTAKWLKIGANLSASVTKYHTINTGWYYESPIMQGVINSPYHTPYELIVNEDGSISQGETYDVYPWDNSAMDLIKYYEKNDNVRNNITFTGQVYELFSPLKGLNIRLRQAVDGFDYFGEGRFFPSHYMNNGKGTVSDGFQRYYQLSSTNTVEYKRAFGKHNTTFLLGHESIVKFERTFNATGVGQSDDRTMNFGSATSITQWGGGTSKNNLNSFFFNVNYDWNNRYFIDASIRTDGSSMFGKDYRYALFFSVGGMWKIKSEPFMKDVNWLDDLNLNISYGTTGNSAFDNWYPSVGLVGSGAKYDGEDGWALAQMERKDLTWESVGILNARLSGSFIGRISFDFQFYNKDSRNLLMMIPLSATTGFPNNYGNVGNMVNRGVELDLSADIIHNKDFLWNIRGNVNYNKNKITKLFSNMDEQTFPDIGRKYKVGESATRIYTQIRAGVDPEDGLPMWKDLNGNLTKIYSDDIMQYWDNKDTTAPWTGGFGTTFSWKGLSFTADFSWVGERWVFINERYYTMNTAQLMRYNSERKMLDIWTHPGQVTDIPKYGTPYYPDTSQYSNASFIRLKNISLSYSLPKKLLENTRILSEVRFYVTGRNLLTFTGFEGYDPEVAYGNATNGMYPNSMQIVGGIDITF